MPSNSDFAHSAARRQSAAWAGCALTLGMERKSISRWREFSRVAAMWASTWESGEACMIGNMAPPAELRKRGADICIR
jgi:hypothetical protein